MQARGPRPYVGRARQPGARGFAHFAKPGFHAPMCLEISPTLQPRPTVYAVEIQMSSRPTFAQKSAQRWGTRPNLNM